MEATLKYRGRVIIKGISSFIDERTKVLDIGCGNGVISDQIAKHFKCYMAGTDIWRYLRRDMPFKEILEDKLDFQNNEFDFGLFNDVLHHVSQERQMVLVKEALRVCRKVLIFEVAPTFMAKLVEFPLNWINNIHVANPLAHRDKEDWMRLFKENNIRCEFYQIAKPSFWYPFINYLFHLKNK